MEKSTANTDEKGGQRHNSEPASYSRQCLQLTRVLSLRLLADGLSITTAESCTSGMLAAALTDLSGSSSWFERGAVTYSNTAKNEMLGVPAEIIDTEGAVSEACVRAMAFGALRAAGANVAVSISGIAGPDGGSVKKPVGTVWMGWALELPSKAGNDTEDMADTPRKVTILAGHYHFEGTRSRVREQAVLQALRDTIDILERADFDNRNK
ncbi:MAG: CinA family protein [Granulosicoccus sp.]